MNNQFKHLEKVVWRLRILDQNGKALDGSALKDFPTLASAGDILRAR